MYQKYPGFGPKRRYKSGLVRVRARMRMKATKKSLSTLSTQTESRLPSCTSGGTRTRSWYPSTTAANETGHTPQKASPIITPRRALRKPASESFYLATCFTRARTSSSSLPGSMMNGKKC